MNMRDICAGICNDCEHGRYITGGDTGERVWECEEEISGYCPLEEEKHEAILDEIIDYSAKLDAYQLSEILSKMWEIPEQKTKEDK